MNRSGQQIKLIFLICFEYLFEQNSEKKLLPNLPGNPAFLVYFDCPSTPLPKVCVKKKGRRCGAASKFWIFFGGGGI